MKAAAAANEIKPTYARDLEFSSVNPQKYTRSYAHMNAHTHTHQNHTHHSPAVSENNVYIYSGAKKYLVSHQVCKFSHLKR